MAFVLVRHHKFSHQQDAKFQHKIEAIPLKRRMLEVVVALKDGQQAVFSKQPDAEAFAARENSLAALSGKFAALKINGCDVYIPADRSVTHAA